MPFKHLLVPLDGSRLAESVLPAAVYLAETLAASVTLLHVIEQHAPAEVHKERHLTRPDEAQAYLDEVARKAFRPGLAVARHVHTDQVRDVAASLAAHAAELQPDLIVMCTHGRSGLQHWLFGSLAQKIISHSPAPVLLIHPAEDGRPVPFHPRQVLAPLDGDAAHERGLTVAADLARACRCALHLTVVIPTAGSLAGEQAAAGRLLPLSMTALLDLDEQGAAAYLQTHLERLQAGGLTATAESIRGEPADTLVASARRLKADLIVFSTHGRAGLDAFWSGSVAPKVAAKTHSPVLLVPLHPA